MRINISLQAVVHFTRVVIFDPACFPCRCKLNGRIHHFESIIVTYVKVLRCVRKWLLIRKKTFHLIICLIFLKAETFHWRRLEKKKNLKNGGDFCIFARTKMWWSGVLVSLSSDILWVSVPREIFIQENSWLICVYSTERARVWCPFMSYYSLCFNFLVFRWIDHIDELSIWKSLSLSLALSLSRSLYLRFTTFSFGSTASRLCVFHL